MQLNPIKPVTEILNPIAPIAQYLSANDTAEKKLFDNSDIDEDLGLKINLIRRSVTFMHNRNPNNATLRGTSNYLYALLGKYALLAGRVLTQKQAAPPLVSGPSNVTVTVNQNASFTIVITSTLPTTIAWYRNGVLIPGQTNATYTLNNAQMVDNGAQFYAIVSNTAGSVQSATGVLTVNSAIIGQYWYGDTDYTAELNNGIDNVPYIGAFNITDGQPLSVPFPLAAANNKFIVVKYPDSQSVKLTWFDTPLNQGDIPDSVMSAIKTFGGSRRIFSRVAMSQDTASPMIFT